MEPVLVRPPGPAFKAAGLRLPSRREVRFRCPLCSIGKLGRPGMSDTYDPREIEPKWQAVWEREGLYSAEDSPADERARFYALDMFPYPSGDLHMGHAGAFAIGDVIARVRWMQGDNALHPIGGE